MKSSITSGRTMTHCLDMFSPPELIHKAIAERAYWIYQANGKHEGRALDDWLQAEQLVLGLRHEQSEKSHMIH